jgi:serine/threonine-protein kinase
MLAREPANRPTSCDAVATEAEAFLEGARERERRRLEAQALCERAEGPAGRERKLDRDRERIEARARSFLLDVKGHEPVERKRPGWALEDQAQALDIEQAQALAEAIDLYTKALGYDPKCTDARAGLARLYFARAVRAEEERRQATRVYYEALVAEYDEGSYTALLRADAALSVESDPSEARVTAHRYVERDRVLLPDEGRDLGATPLREVHLEPGSYLIVLERRGFRAVRYPVLLKRGDHHQGLVRLYTDAEIGKDFVYIPGGSFIAGGDRQAHDSLPRMQLDVPDFAMGRFPVTFRDYCRFLEDLDRSDPKAARRRIPSGGSDADHQRPIHRTAHGHWEPTLPGFEGEALKMFPPEDGHLWQQPIFFIDWFDAVAYCRWRSKRDGCELRLPTELEWEKAARGTDGRYFPWGDRFDPTFCKMRESRPFRPQPEPVGTFPVDTSPYGVRDMVGNVREWVGDIHGERTWLELSSEPEPELDAPEDTVTWRGFRSGNWVAIEPGCRAASRARFPALTRYATLSFRIAHSLSRGSKR